MFINFLSQAIVLIIVTSCVPLAICSACSLIIAILQTVTQIQEQTLSYLVRFGTIIIVYYFCAGWFFSEYINFFELSFSSIKVLGSVR